MAAEVERAETRRRTRWDSALARRARWLSCRPTAVPARTSQHPPWATSRTGRRARSGSRWGTPSEAPTSGVVACGRCSDAPEPERHTSSSGAWGPGVRSRRRRSERASGRERIGKWTLAEATSDHLGCCALCPRQSSNLLRHFSRNTSGADGWMQGYRTATCGWRASAGQRWRTQRVVRRQKGAHDDQTPAVRCPRHALLPARPRHTRAR